MNSEDVWWQVFLCVYLSVTLLKWRGCTSEWQHFRYEWKYLKPLLKWQLTLHLFICSFILVIWIFSISSRFCALSCLLFYSICSVLQPPKPLWSEVQCVRIPGKSVIIFCLVKDFAHWLSSFNVVLIKKEYSSNEEWSHYGLLSCGGCCCSLNCNTFLFLNCCCFCWKHTKYDLPCSSGFLGKAIQTQGNKGIFWLFGKYAHLLAFLMKVRWKNLYHLHVCMLNMGLQPGDN